MRFERASLWTSSCLGVSSSKLLERMKSSRDKQWS